MDPDAWRARSSQEVNFWENWVKTGGSQWPDGFKRKTNPDAPLIGTAEAFLTELGHDPARVCKVLDIGSGPLSYVGTKSDTYSIDLTIVDPLADDYNRLLDAKGVTGVARPQEGYFETATRQFGTNAFDLVWCFNSLDHSMDPLLGLFNLLSVCRIGGGLILSFHPNEADRGKYQGLHQWNLDYQEDKIVMSQMGRQMNLMPLLEQQQIVSLTQLEDDIAGGGKGPILLKVKKTTECNLSQCFIA